MTISGLFPALLALQFGGGGAMTPFLVQLVAIFAIFYFLLIRPQQAQKKKHEAALKAHMGVEVPVMVRTASELAEVVKAIEPAYLPDGQIIFPSSRCKAVNNSVAPPAWP